GEPVVNASVFINSSYQSVTDQYGYYSIALPPGKYVLNVVAIGMKDTHVNIQVHSDGRLNLDIQDQVATLKEVIVSSRKSSNVTQDKMEVHSHNIYHIRRALSIHVITQE